MKPIPFDAFVLAAVVAELTPFVGGKIQEIRQPTDVEVVLGLYSRGQEGMLLLSWDARHYRALLTTRRPGTLTPAPHFLTALRSRLAGGIIKGIQQVEEDRILEITVSHSDETFRLVAELTGAHSNLILLGPDQRVLATARASHGSRNLRPGAPYALPPAGGGSPFFRTWRERGNSASGPIISHGFGAYPASVAHLGYAEHGRESMSIALEQHYADAIPNALISALRSSLLGRLSKLLNSRNHALEESTRAQSQDSAAERWQRLGELVLAYGPSALAAASELAAFDYDGAPITIPLDPERDFKQNADAFFKRAKKAKARRGQLADQIQRLTSEASDLAHAVASIQEAASVNELRDLEQQARERRWLIDPTPSKHGQAQRPFEGHRIRQIEGPGGFTILVGETATANDYLTQQVAKPNDYWLHVRGGRSAHVVIRTGNHPERVTMETLLAAAKLAAQHSPSKHSKLVAVDYTLKKYVRKPKGLPPGSVICTNEKTLDVEG